MFVQRFPIVFGVTIMSLLMVVACTPEGSALSNSSETETPSSQAQSSDEDVIVDTTPMSQEELEAQPAGQSEPGAGTGDSGAQVEDRQPLSGAIVTYADDTYKFSVEYPSEFVFRTQPIDKLVQLTPKPDSSFIFMDPVTASSDIVDLELADLEIRVFVTGQISSLDSWLSSNGLWDNTVELKPFKTANVSGVEVCASTMIAPGCSYFVIGSDWVYQLTPATLEGENMINTFMLLP